MGQGVFAECGTEFVNNIVFKRTPMLFAGRRIYKFINLIISVEGNDPY